MLQLLSHEMREMQVDFHDLFPILSANFTKNMIDYLAKPVMKELVREPRQRADRETKRKVSVEKQGPTSWKGDGEQPDL